MEQKINRKKVLVLGGSGFIGSAIVNLLISHSDKYDVWVLVHRSYNVQALESVKVIRGSLESLDLSWLDIIQPDLILHMARINGSGTRGRRRAARRGRKANLRLIDRIKLSCPEVHVIYVSGTLVYGDHGEKTVDEECALNPISYAREYIHAETPWMDALDAGEMKVSMMHPPWILGLQSWFGEFFIKFMKRHNQIPLFGNGNNWMSIIDLADCAGLILRYIESEKTNDIFNVFNPNGLIKMRDFVKLIQEETGLEIKKVPVEMITSTFDRATAEAFTFSLKSTSLHDELITTYTYKHLNPKNIIENNLSFSSL